MKAAVKAEAEAVGERLMELRRELGLRRKAVAGRLRMTERNYGFYESGDRRLWLDDVPRLAEALGISTDRLLLRLGLLGAESDNAKRPSAQIADAVNALMDDLSGVPDHLGTAAVNSVRSMLREWPRSRDSAKHRYRIKRAEVVGNCPRVPAIVAV